ncbi:hypothetical protein Nepgr_029658 [Nepenthes gracilis]|uniref:Pectinesterase inhibitor domain-containing protein n=1 Tax=Nepenthes gracilis TaxID=150966 RepID=A0AAD3TCX7_NEPGR|nr:hypothetical protein Nepgr_029658 [Nepenthes gracilis]
MATLLSSVEIPIFLCLFTVVYTILSSVHGDEELIRKVCSKTSSPDVYCLGCLHTNPRSPELDVRELAGTAIFCACNQSDATVAAFNRYATMTSDQDLVNAFAYCADAADIVGEKATVALSSWGDGNYKDSEDELNSARDVDIVNCRTELNKTFSKAGKPPFPQELQVEFTGLLGVVTIAEEIVEQI